MMEDLSWITDKTNRQKHNLEKQSNNNAAYFR